MNMHNIIVKTDNDRNKWQYYTSRLFGARYTECHIVSCVFRLHDTIYNLL